jgi:uncharacterized protein YjbI with pentapeptide repeats
MIEIRHKDTGKLLARVTGETLAGARLCRLKLQGANLRGADLRAAVLARGDLSGADLEGASLVEVQGTARTHWIMAQWLVGVVFMGTQALCRCVMQPPQDWVRWLAWTVPTTLILGFFMRALLMARASPRPGSTVKLAEANLRGADLTGAELEGTDLERADLAAAILTRAYLRGAVLRGSNLQGAKLAGASLSGADLKSADVRGADLRQGDLRYADLRGADLRGADLRGQLDGAKLQGARYDEATRWPVAFQPATRGCVAAGEVLPAAAPRGHGSEPITADAIPTAGAGRKTPGGSLWPRLRPRRAPLPATPNVLLEIRHRASHEVLHRAYVAPPTEAGLVGVRLVGADLRGADLQGVNLYHADLTDADLEGALMAHVECASPTRLRSLVRGFACFLLAFDGGLFTLLQWSNASARGLRPRGASVWDWLVANVFTPGWPGAFVVLFLLSLIMAGALWPLMVWIAAGVTERMRDCTTATLTRANLRGADLTGANLDWADLQEAQLQQAVLDGVRLEHARLRGAQLQDARLRGAQLGKATRGMGAPYPRTDLRGASFQGADLGDALLRYVDLRGADLRATNLLGADLYGADLREADLRGTDLRSTGTASCWVRHTNLHGASYDAHTRWPEGFDPAKQGGVRVE